MLKTSRFVALLILSVIAASPVYAEEKSAAKVNGVSIPQVREDMAVKNLVAKGQTDTPKLRKSVRNSLIETELLSQEATKMGLDKQPEIAQQLELTRQQLLVRAFVLDYLKKHAVSEEAVTKKYEELKSKSALKAYNVLHILVKSKKLANSIHAKLAKGQKFASLAKTYSIDASTKDKGGNMGLILVSDIQNSFVKPLGATLMSLSKGQISKPVQSKFGWHILMLKDVQDLKLNDIKAKIKELLQKQEVKKASAAIRSKAKIE